MIALDLRARAPVGHHSLGPKQPVETRSAPPNAVVMRAVPAKVPALRARGSIHYRDWSEMVDGYRFIVRGLDFVDGFEAMRFADRLSAMEGRPVFIAGLP